MRSTIPALAACLLLVATSQSAARDAAYVACDNGLRCLVAPCPSTTVRDVATGKLWKGTSPDISRLSEVDQQRIRETDALYFGRLVLRGHIEKQANGPSALVVTGIERKAKPAERRHCPRG
ncbi:hypothetical protein [Shinella zoogloeoides]|uniref:Uncharacterized protein n=1 Tax=Shinella zoogloeoides TaxID=352475 RepID=A0A6N8TH70_SHIZO|nr:hypothetical protein [Shinella zoogloeoides]MXO02623.1 hypothetical protein [Shinella zoogloeoides]UEX80154.1 hypothetical protein K8M09_10975 [Shinella zoogloeoides]